MAKALIEYALFHNSWTYSKDAVAVLEREGTRVPPEDFDSGMSNRIFCPTCWTPITRRPTEGEFCSNQKKAYFAHIPSFKDVPCIKRTPPAQGELFPNEEVARQAINRGDLIVFAGFAEEPQAANEQANAYAQGQIEDPAGPVTQVPIARHVGDAFLVPGRNRTILSICRNFDQNLDKYYQLPGQSTPIKLSEQLHDVLDVVAEDDVPRLYFGQIRAVKQTKYQRLARLTSNPAIQDFTLPASTEQHDKRHVSKDAIGDFVLFWGRVTGYGTGLGTRVQWGEYAKLPPAYAGEIARIRAARAARI